MYKIIILLAFVLSSSLSLTSCTKKDSANIGNQTNISANPDASATIPNQANNPVPQGLVGR